MTEVEELRSARLRRSLQSLVLAVLGVAVLGLLAGYLFATSSPPRAAATRISAFVRIEPAATPADDVETWDPAAPTSGAARDDAGCGVLDRRLPTDDQVAALAAGRVLLQYRPDDVDAAGREELHTVADRHRADVLLAPNPDLSEAVMATAWSRRMALRSVDADLAGAFVIAYAGGGPAPAPCDRP